MFEGRSGEIAMGLLQPLMGRSRCPPLHDRGFFRLLTVECGDGFVKPRLPFLPRHSVRAQHHPLVRLGVG